MQPNFRLAYEPSEEERRDLLLHRSCLAQEFILFAIEVATFANSKNAYGPNLGFFMRRRVRRLKKELRQLEKGLTSVDLACRH